MGLAAENDLEGKLSGRNVIVLFQATWCPFCQDFLPLFDRHAATFADFEPLCVALDNDDDPLWEKYGIDVVPTVIAFESGRIAHRLDGRRYVGLSEDDLLGFRKRTAEGG